MANGENVRDAYTGIIDLLPVDWQRFVNDQLPHLEGVIDQEVERFGEELAKYLVETVERSVEGGKADVGRADEAMRSAIEGLEESRKRADEGFAMVDHVKAALSALDVTGVKDVVSLGLWHAHALRGLLDRLREDFAADRVQGLIAYRVSLGQWRKLAVEADLVTDQDLQLLVAAAAGDHAELSMPEQVATMHVSSTVESEHERAEALQAQMVEALDASPTDDQPHWERLGRALGDLADEVRKTAEGEAVSRSNEDVDDVRATVATLERAMARIRAPALPGVPDLANAWINARVAVIEQDEVETARDARLASDSMSVSDDTTAPTDSRAAQEAPPDDVAGDPRAASVPGSAATDLESLLAAERAALEALRESLTQLKGLVDRRAGLLPRLQSIKERHADLVERLKAIALEAEQSELRLEAFNASRQAVMQARQQLLQKVGELTEEVATKIMGNALAAKAATYRAVLKKADDDMKAFKQSHQTAEGERRKAVAEMEKARRSLAGSARAYAAAVETVRAGARAAKLPMGAKKEKGGTSRTPTASAKEGDSDAR